MPFKTPTLEAREPAAYPGALAFSRRSGLSANLAALRLLPTRQQALLAADWAELALPYWEKAYPGHPWPRMAIDTARGLDDPEVARLAGSRMRAVRYYATQPAQTFASAEVHQAYWAAYAAHRALVAATDARTDAGSEVVSASVSFAAEYVVERVSVSLQLGVAVRWLGAYNRGLEFRPEWRTPLAEAMAEDPDGYPYLLDHLEECGADVELLRALTWAGSNWAVYHALRREGGRP